MEAFALYLLKSVIWLTGFAVVYYLFLQNERFFSLKRYYLVAGVLISIIFPLFTFHYQVEMPAPSDNIPGLIPSGTGVTSAIQPVSNDINLDFRYILMLAYLSGILFFIFKSIRHARSLLKTINKTKVNSLNPAKIVRTSDISGSFSFFNYVFINPSVEGKELDVIMNHELVHVNQKHWLDLLLGESLRMIQWINPVVWIYTGFIRQNHEYIADAVALKQTPDPAVYKAVLVNQLFDSKVFSLSNSFDYSLNKKRFDMMKKIIVSPYRKMRLLLVLPVFAFVFYAFAKPEYQYVKIVKDPVYLPQAEISRGYSINQKTVKGIVVNAEGQPIEKVAINSTGTAGNVFAAETGKDGRFELSYVQADASLMFYCRGYKPLTIKPDFSKDMSIKLEKIPEYEAPSAVQRPNPIVVIDGVISEKYYRDVFKDLGYDMGPFKFLSGKEATEKYGEKGANGVYEITTRTKALAMGIKSPLPRLGPDDYPTFQNQGFGHFNDWVANQVKYPPEAEAKKLEGWIQINFTVEMDGTLSNIKPAVNSDPILSEEVMRVIRTSPKWDRPKNPAVEDPYASNVNIGFRLPDQVIKEPPFVVVEEMPMYPGGEGELLKFLEENTKFPEAAKADTIQGKVIVRFIVNTEGNAEGVTVLKGVHPLLDAEAARVVKLLSGFKPGMQGGKAVNVWYMVPINFALPYTKKK